MKKVAFLILILNFSILFSQENKPTTPKKSWTTKGKVSFLFNQSAFSNWVARGENTLAGNIGINYNFNYAKGKYTWKNNILTSYGLTKSKNTEFEKKTDDRLEFNSLLGINAESYWYYSVLFNFKTQFTKGFKYSKDENGKEIRTEHTNFFSPATFLIGPGMLWEKNENFKFNIAPATTKLVIVDKNFTLPNSAYFGVEEGENTRLELGFNASGRLKVDLMENISMEQLINLYANYLENPENIDIDYTMNLVMKINNHFTTNLIFQTIYDDNAFEGFQIREVFGLSFNYDFK
ncbi:Protein of unknown function (DUF3078) [Lutibacter oceani]|uniref:DUF3078 domain-containing protein n=1 Tax=Lutibacter oceani TaxID=1853311 RepID=A0A3D9S3T6_9FLAO|nr:DUF3078 domain-containing protein [Lutibacter oceani]REE83505.1 Protein of unknown function (DUF3078) [Lutibacter oceani]